MSIVIFEVIEFRFHLKNQRNVEASQPVEGYYERDHASTRITGSMKPKKINNDKRNPNHCIISLRILSQFHRKK